MTDLFCTTGPSPTISIEEITSLATGSATDPCRFETAMPDSTKLELALTKWKTCLEIEKSNIQTKWLFNKKILSINDLIVITGFAKQTIYNMVSQNRIPYSKRGRKLFFSSFEILNWIQEGDSV